MTNTRKALSHHDGGPPRHRAKGPRENLWRLFDASTNFTPNQNVVAQMENPAASNRRTFAAAAYSNRSNQAGVALSGSGAIGPGLAAPSPGAEQGVPTRAPQGVPLQIVSLSGPVGQNRKTIKSFGSAACRKAGGFPHGRRQSRTSPSGMVGRDFFTRSDKW